MDGSQGGPQGLALWLPESRQSVTLPDCSHQSEWRAKSDVPLPGGSTPPTDQAPQARGRHRRRSSGRRPQGCFFGRNIGRASINRCAATNKLFAALAEGWGTQFLYCNDTLRHKQRSDYKNSCVLSVQHRDVVGLPACELTHGLQFRGAIIQGCH